MHGEMLQNTYKEESNGNGLEESRQMGADLKATVTRGTLDESTPCISSMSLQ